jgi:hypothetical protein
VLVTAGARYNDSHDFFIEVWEDLAASFILHVGIKYVDLGELGLLSFSRNQTVGDQM